MQYSRYRAPHRSATIRPLWQRTLLGICILFLAVATFLTFADAVTVHARQTPNRRDRRPDREVRIRYPRTQPQNSNQGNDVILQSAPPTPQGNSPSASQNSPSPGE
jgi:hypothetical protein